MKIQHVKIKESVIIFFLDEKRIGCFYNILGRIDPERDHWVYGNCDECLEPICADCFDDDPRKGYVGEDI